MTFEIYLARDGWRWRLTGRNGRIVADSGEAYVKKSNCVRARDRMIDEIVRLIDAKTLSP